MTRARTLVWLIALAAFVVPSFGAAAASHAAGQSMGQPVEQGAPAASVDCPDHAPPPKPCPEQGTAKHAAGECCPLMGGVVAVLPAGIPVASALSLVPPVAATVRSLTGISFNQDPPPPRV
ncbi:MAG: hypothetical protein PSV46_02295 [Reyranella sp.]|nr:hypothetical protein [Reyranella sp.]